MARDDGRTGKMLLLENSDYVSACRDETVIVGCARVFWDKGAVAYLADVMVKPEYQGQGIGTKMINDCIAKLRNQLKDGGASVL